MGVLSGFVFNLLLVTAARLSPERVSSILAVVAEILAIPTFWFSGNWITTGSFRSIPTDPYVITLASVFSAFVIVPLYRWTERIAREVGEEVG